MDDQKSARAFDPYLLSGERILWAGQPKQGLAFAGKDVFLIPFSLLWGGFAIFWNAAVWFAPFGGDGAGWFFKLWGLPFLVIGLYFIAGRFLHDAHIRKQLVYSVTDQRILTLRRSTISSMEIDRLPRLEFSEHRDGTGTLTFGSGSQMAFLAMSGVTWWLPSAASPTQMFRIKNARTVYELIRKGSRPQT